MSFVGTIVSEILTNLGFGAVETWVESKRDQAKAPLYLHNTLGNEKQIFELPPRVHTVRMYSCGPTVYGVQHIGNLSMFVFTDTLRHVLEYNGFPVKQVINFTDFGHLVSDGDEGEDKMTKGLKREKLALNMANMRKLADKYAAVFLSDISTLNIDTEQITFPYASEYVKAQIAMIHSLEEKGYTYTTSGGVYFDTSRYPEYGKLGNIDLKGLREGARVAVSHDKRSPTDFLLWKCDKKLGWDSPWGKGFPGWHIECSAMIRATLGEQIDIHTGGIEHIAVHHNNEIAQSESATGKKPLSRFWLHRAHIQIEGGKIAKSQGNVVYLSEIIERGIHPLALRYLYLGAHYRTPMNFSWESLEAAERAYARLLAARLSIEAEPTKPNAEWRAAFIERVNDDLDTAGAIGITWEMLKDPSLGDDERLATLLDFDRVFGLNLDSPDANARALAQKEMRSEIQNVDIPPEVQELMTRRDQAREDRNWTEADTLREEIEQYGYTVDDTPHGTRVFKKNL